MSAENELGNAFYLYAIVPRDACASIRGDLGDEVRLVDGGGVFGAVVRPTAATSFVGRDRRHLARLLLAHQQVVENIMAHGPVLPVKFATIAPDEESVERCLKSGGAAFAEAFARLAGKIQYEILVTWDLDQVLAEIARSPEVISMKQVMATPVELGTAVKNLLERRRCDIAGEISEALRAIAEDFVDNALMNDRMVLNIALLIDEEKLGALDDCLETLDASRDGKLGFRCVGPLPPYSFATVEASFLDKGRVSHARDLLELDENADAVAVHDAYRRLARMYHPDVAGEGGGDDRMAILHDAYRTLRAVAEASGPVQVAVRRQELKVESGAC